MNAAKGAPVRCAALVALMTLGLGACGGDDKGVTKAAFLRRASAGCTNPSTESKESKAVRRAISNAETPERQAKVYREQVLPRATQALDAIAKLEPPEADRDRVARFIKLARREWKNFADMLESDPSAALLLRPQLLAKSNAAATAYGLKICIY